MMRLAMLAFPRAEAYRPRMARTEIEVVARMLDQAYRTDPFAALRRNLASVTPEEWDVRPAEYSVDEFGTEPELSICDIALHTGAKYMYYDRAFGEMKIEWGDIAPQPSRSMDDVLAWLDEAHRLMMEGLASLDDDERLRDERQAPWRTPMKRGALIALISNHDLYHSGEVNRQRALIRGASGWSRSM
jgi:uncharacterized damage-inducible protein DinB